MTTTDTDHGHRRSETHTGFAVVGSTPHRASLDSSPKDPTPGGAHPSPAAKKLATTHPSPAAGEHDIDRGRRRYGAHTSPATVEPFLDDPTLLVFAEAFDDLQKSRIANENRARSLRQSGLADSAALDAVDALVTVVAGAEHQASLALGRVMRKHPLGPWFKAQKGVGEHTGALLLATIGDPYVRQPHADADGVIHDAATRTVSQLWALCGLVPGQKRTKGQKSNWNARAKSLAWRGATGMLKAGNREGYDKRRHFTADRLHATDCVRCGPSGKPALAGTPWSLAHQHNDALRVVSKQLLRDLWAESKRLHELRSGHLRADTHGPNAAADSS